MSYELVYTSAPQGLRKGASGFCTVAATDGMPRLLYDKMESLSGYNHIRNVTGDPPVNHSHVTLRIQRTVYHVLSRVADAGVDHTHRSNKIAHHLALTSAEIERFPDGPASLFADHAFWYSEWDQEPQTFGGGRLPNAYGWSGADFSAWTAVFNDPGWAGLMAQSAVEGGKPVTVIVPQGEDVMELLNEALQLVAPRKRWSVGFSTYFFRLAPGTECQWRFVLDGTSEARKLRTRAPGLLIDPIGSTKEPPAGNPFVEAAREGQPESVIAAPAKTTTGRFNTQRDTDYSSRGSTDRGGRKRVSAGRRPDRRVSRRGQSSRRSRQEDIEHLEEYDDSSQVPETRSQTMVAKKTEVRLVIALAVIVLVILIYVGVEQFLLG